MAKGAYLGVSSKARKVKKAYIGVDGKARKVKKMYVGVDGKARLFFADGKDVEWLGATTLTTGARWLSATSFSTAFGIFAGGFGSTYTTIKSDNFTVVRADLVKTVYSKSAVMRHLMTAFPINDNYACFMNGAYISTANGATTYQQYGRRYDDVLTESWIYGSAPASYARAGTSVGGYGIAAGGLTSSLSNVSYRDAFNESGTAYSSQDTDVTSGGFMIGGANTPDYAVVMSVYGYPTAWNSSLTRSNPTRGVSQYMRQNCSTCGAWVGNYAMFVGTYYANNQYSNVMMTYNNSLTKGSATPFGAGTGATYNYQGYIASGNFERTFAIFQTESDFVCYNESLTKTYPINNDSTEKTFGAACPVGNEGVLIGGGYFEGSYIREIDLFGYS